VGAMGERFLILEETADALDVIDPELAVHFRKVNGLPRQAFDELPVGLGAPDPAASMGPPDRHEIRMDVGDRHIRSDCSCGAWTSVVEWDEIDTMVMQVREHLGSVQASTEDGIKEAASPVGPSAVAKRVG